MKKTALVALLAFTLLLTAAAQTPPAAKTEDFSKTLVKVAKPEAPPADIKAGFDTISARGSLSMLTFIASDLLEGREAGTRGYQLAAEYAASLFGMWGLTPMGDFAPRSFSMAQYFSGATAAPKPPQKTFWQEFPLQETLETSSRMALEVRHGQAVLNREFQAGADYSSQAATGDVLTAPVVFAGYGVVDKDAKYDDLKDIDVKGKVVLVLSGAPPFIAGKPMPPGMVSGMSMSGMSPRLEALVKRGPAAILTVNPAGQDMARYKSLLPAKSVPDETPIIHKPYRQMSIPGAAVPMPWDKPVMMQISNRTADAILAAAGRTLESAKKAIDQAKKPASFDVPGASLTIASTLKTQMARGINVVGMIEGSDPALKSEAIVIGAHLDHTGRFEDYIFNGADDNGSGSVGVLNLAQAFAANPKKPKRTIIFALWTGEEKGLLGSEYFVKHPPVPGLKIVTYLNFDMMSRAYDEKSLAFAARTMGVPSSPEFLKAVTPANFMLIHFQEGSSLGEAAREADRYVGLDLYLRAAKTGGISFGDSDHSSFNDVKIPWLWPFSAVTPDLHQTSDSVDKVSGELMEKTSRLMYGIAWIAAEK
ncbi:MAG: M20/M25/M40 family metallo-hydrolase [Candidatus Aminicenantes bacterium]|nr:M20/M25/M40 family metallo-hydrolase [Candidatus Aminicenantes bacterium]